MQSRLQAEMALTTCSAADTRSLGRALGARLEPGDLVCLRGELGAGKTTLIQGLAEGLGVPHPATSPSFTLLHEHQGRFRFYHLDLYRLGPGDLDDIGLEEILDSDAVVAVEWSERLPAHLCDDALVVEMEMDRTDENVRHLRLRSAGPRGRRLMVALGERSHARAGD